MSQPVQSNQQIFDSLNLAKPAGSDNLSITDDELRLLKNAVAAQLSQEHFVIGKMGGPAAAADTATASVDANNGRHRPGSAVAFSGAAAPTQERDGPTLSDIDIGRLWVKINGTSPNFYYELWSYMGTAIGWVRLGNLISPNETVFSTPDHIVFANGNSGHIRGPTESATATDGPQANLGDTCVKSLRFGSGSVITDISVVT